MTKQITAVAAAGLSLFAASAGFAQTSAMSHSTMSHSTMSHSKMAHSTMHKPMAAKAVYVCKDCKEFFSATQAKKMGYKDSMGHKLTKMSKTPAGFSDGSKMKM